MAQHTLELSRAVLPAGEERATRCKDKWEARARRATGVLANARLLCLHAPTKQQARSHGNVLSEERREGSTVTRSGGTMLLVPPAQHGCGAGAPARPLHCWRRPAAFPHGYFLPLAAVWGCQKPKQEWKHPILLAKIQGRVGVFFFGFGFFLFFVLVFGYERKFPAMKS